MCHKLKDQLVDWTVEVNFRLSWMDTIGLKTTEEKYNMIKDKVRDLNDLISDSKSAPSCSIDMVTQKLDLCSHCKSPWETFYDHDLNSECCAHCGQEITEKDK